MLVGSLRMLLGSVRMLLTLSMVTLAVTPGPANLASKVVFWPFQVCQPSAILILPALVNRMPPKTSSMYPSSISRALCSDGMRCIKPLAPSRNETNSSRVNGGADGAILGICAYGRPDQAGIRRFPRWPVSGGLQDGKAPAGLLESHGGILPKPLHGRRR